MMQQHVAQWISACCKPRFKSPTQARSLAARLALSSELDSGLELGSGATALLARLDEQLAAAADAATALPEEGEATEVPQGVGYYD